MAGRAVMLMLKSGMDLLSSDEIELTSHNW
jgi:hypothetical protein